MNGVLTLGPIEFRQFEVPSFVTSGGRQKLAVHALADGGRLIERLGSEEADISFSGIFSGPDAVARSQSLDGLRKTGKPILVTWNGHYVNVIVSSVRTTYYNSAWVGYSAICTVVDNVREQISEDTLSFPYIYDIGAVSETGDIFAAISGSLVDSYSMSGSFGQAPAPFSIGAQPVGAVLGTLPVRYETSSSSDESATPGSYRASIAHLTLATKSAALAARAHIYSKFNKVAASANKV